MKLIIIMVLNGNSISQHEYVFNSKEACHEALQFFGNDSVVEALKGNEKNKKTKNKLVMLAVCVPDPLIQG